MYCNSVSRVLYQYQRHPSFLHVQRKHFVDKESASSEKIANGIFQLCSVFMKNLLHTKAVLNSNYNLCESIRLFYTQYTIIHNIRQSFLKVPQCLKEHSVQIVKMCTQQCECVMAHRIRRGQQIFSLYSKLWDEVALKELVSKMKRQLSRKGKEMLLGAVGVTAFNWEKERIPDEEMLEHINELDNIYSLLQRTMMCRLCQRRVIVDVANPKVSYCSCNHKAVCCRDPNSGWIPFIEREDLLIWRKEWQGLYAYKVYGAYNDVTAEDFLQVQIDTDYRREWDTTAAELRIVDADPASNSTVVYWEMQWPRLFANRDYVFNRRYMVDAERKVMLIVNQDTKHPACPIKPQNHRVEEYWSYMVIKPYTSFTKPGIEFSLTYFDNPGVSIPSSVTSWVAMSGLPDFMLRLRRAARELSVRKASDSSLQPNPVPIHPPPPPPPSSAAVEDPAIDSLSHSYFTPLHGIKLVM